MKLLIQTLAVAATMVVSDGQFNNGADTKALLRDGTPELILKRVHLAVYHTSEAVKRQIGAILD
jgi:hypothetical protein